MNNEEERRNHVLPRVKIDKGICMLWARINDDLEQCDTKDA